MFLGISFATFAVASLLFAGFVQEPMAYLKEENEGLYRQLGGSTAPLWSWSWGDLSLFVVLGAYKRYSLSERTVRGFRLCRGLALIQTGSIGAILAAIVFA